MDIYDVDLNSIIGKYYYVEKTNNLTIQFNNPGQISTLRERVTAELAKLSSTAKLDAIPNGITVTHLTRDSYLLLISNLTISMHWLFLPEKPIKKSK